MIDPNEDLLSALADGELAPDERAAVVARLAQSAERRAELAEVAEARALVRALPVREAPAGFWDAVLQPDVAASAGRGARRGAGSRALRWVAGAAAAAALLAVVLVPREAETKPPVAALVERHAARSSFSVEPVSQLAPVATPEGR